jgi:4'-phosphopantetheinyl transferase
MPAITSGSDLVEGEVDVFIARLDDNLVDELLPSLSPDERDRANRFVFKRDRNRFIAARGLFRKLLSGYLATSPSAIEFSYGDQGKPMLAGAVNRPLKFNLAHSHELAAYAFTSNREVGVDLEFTGRHVEIEAIARRFFAPEEVRELIKLPLEDRHLAFFDCWTRKEAYIKARGGGLSIPLDEFNVSLAPDKPAALLENYRDAEECSRWTMEALPLGTEYRGALVVEGQAPQLKIKSL